MTEGQPANEILQFCTMRSCSALNKCFSFVEAICLENGCAMAWAVSCQPLTAEAQV